MVTTQRDCNSNIVQSSICVSNEIWIGTCPHSKIVVSHKNHTIRTHLSQKDEDRLFELLQTRQEEK